MVRLMAQKEAHCVMNQRIGNQMIIINNQIECTGAVRQLNKQLRKQLGQAGVLALLHHHFRCGAMLACRLLDGGNQVAGKSLRLVIPFVQ